MVFMEREVSGDYLKEALTKAQILNAYWAHSNSIILSPEEPNGAAGRR